jgi:cellulose biosynthesis protein BcsQ
VLASSINYKGGQGKSLWSVILADWLDAEILDLDPRQGDAHAWAEKAGRKSQLVWKNSEKLLRQASADPSWFVADCPPHEGEETRAVLQHSHLVLIPVVPSGAQDARAWGRMQDAIRDARQENPGLKAAAILNASRQTGVSRAFVEMLAAWHAPSEGRAVLGVVPQRVGLAEAFGAGAVPTDPAIVTALNKLIAFAEK